MRAPQVLLIVLLIPSVRGMAKDPCSLPRAPRAILGIAPHETPLSQVRARFGKARPHREPESPRLTLCYVLERGHEREYLLVVSDGFAGRGLVSLVRLSAAPPAGPMVGECRKASSPSRHRSPLGRDVADVVRGLPEPAESRDGGLLYSRRWERKRRTEQGEEYTVNGFCGLSIGSQDGKVTFVESAWDEST